MTLVDAIMARVVTVSFSAIAGVIIACETGHPEAANTFAASAVAVGASLFIRRIICVSNDA